MNKLKKIAVCVSAAIACSYGATAVAAIEAPPAAVADGMLLVDKFSLLTSDGTVTYDGLGAIVTNTLTSAKGTAIPGISTRPTTAAGNDVQVLAGGFGGSAGITDTVLGVAATISLYAQSGPVAGLRGAELSAAGGLCLSNPGCAVDTLAGAHKLATPGPTGILTGAPTSNYSASAIEASGDSATLAGSKNLTHSQVSIGTGGLQTGNASNTIASIIGFELLVSEAGWLEANFDASQFLRAMLGQPLLSTNADTVWNITVKSGSTEIMKWQPGGAGDNLTGTCDTVAFTRCLETSDPFNLNEAVQAAFPNTIPFGHEEKIDLRSDTFEVDLFLDPGLYSIVIEHKTSANASLFFVPEPGTVALLGLGLLGLGLVARRRPIC